MHSTHVRIHLGIEAAWHRNDIGEGIERPVVVQHLGVNVVAIAEPHDVLLPAVAEMHAP